MNKDMLSGNTVESLMCLSLISELPVDQMDKVLGTFIDLRDRLLSGETIAGIALSEIEKERIEIIGNED